MPALSLGGTEYQSMESGYDLVSMARATNKTVNKNKRWQSKNILPALPCLALPCRSFLP
jgi:hypothetical protein